MFTIAEREIWMSVVQFVREHRLTVTLIIEASPSMVLWQETVDSLRQLLGQHSQSWYVDTYTTNAPLLLYREPQSPVNRMNGVDPLDLNRLQQQLFLVLSDCIAPTWYDGLMGQLLNSWAQHHMIALLQMLPPRLWVRTALRNTCTIYLRSHSPATLNQQLERHPQYPSPSSYNQQIPIPIIILEQTSLTNWVQMLVGNSSKWAIGVLFSKSIQDEQQNQSDDEDELEETSTIELTPYQRVEEFQGASSPIAQRLAGYLAAVPLSIPIIRSVQQKMLPESSQAHLAEVLFSRLIEHRTTYSPLLPIEKFNFEFIPGVREVLRTTVSRSKHFETLQKLSAFLDKNPNKTMVDFKALLANPDQVGELSLDEERLPFATIAADTLAQIGGRYYQLAGRLREKVRETESLSQVFLETIGDDAKHERNFTERIVHRTPDSSVLPMHRMPKNLVQDVIGGRIQSLPSPDSDSERRLQELKRGLNALRQKGYRETLQEQQLDRQDAYEQITALLDKALTNRDSNTKRFIFIEGDAGIGKSWLLGYLKKRLKTKGDWTLFDPFDARDFIQNSPYARFISLMNNCAGQVLHDLDQTPALSQEFVLRCAESLEFKLKNRANEPLLLMFDELEHWVDITPQQREYMDMLIRNVWRVLLRQHAMPCVIIGAGRQVPEFRDVLLKRTFHTIRLKGFSSHELMKLVPSTVPNTTQSLIEYYAEGNPWVTQLLSAVLTVVPDAFSSQATREQIRQLLFDRIVEDRPTAPLRTTLYELAQQRGEGFYSDGEALLPKGDLTIASLVRTSFVEFDTDRRLYQVDRLLANLFKEPLP